MFTLSQAAKRLAKSPKTLQRWDREGILVAKRTPTNRRFYTEEQLAPYLGATPRQDTRRVAAYCRVSSAAQRPDLANQRAVIAQFCAVRGLANVDIIDEVGGGLNMRRPKFQKLVDDIVARRVSHLVVAHRDRLARFGFDLLAHLCSMHGCELLVLDNERHSPEREMVDDMLAIVHCFSARLYGLRNYRKALKKAMESK